MFRPFEPLVYAPDAISRYGEPTRLSSDRSPGVPTPISVNALYAGYVEGSYLRGEHRCRAMLDRGVMVEEPLAYIRYTIESRNHPDLQGLVGLLDLDDTTVHEHEGVMPSAVAARSADIERAGAFLEPVVVAVDPAVRPRDLPDGTAMRSVAYGEERHSVAAVDPQYDHGVEASTSFVVIDGHHRIAAARHHAAFNGIEASILAMVVDLSSEGLRVVPQHRVLGGSRFDPGHIPSGLDVAPYRRGTPVAPGDVAIVGPETSVLVSAAAGGGDPLNRISAVLLERRILEPLDLWVEGFATREVDAYREIAAGATAVAIMGDLSMDDIVSTARSGIVLPEKTTCFSPKVAVGLVGVTA